MSRYFNNWRLKINTGKTVCTSFHLAHRLAKYQLQVTCEGQNIPHKDNPKYLGVTLDRTLTYKMHISKLSQKISTRDNLLRRLAGLSWGANFKVLQTAAVCLIYAPADNTDNPITWPMNTWYSRWANLSTPLHRYISSPSTNPIGHDLHRHCWVHLNCLRTGYGRFGQQMFRMGLATDPSCSCGCAVQTAHHAIYDCPITRCPGDFTTLDLRARDWLHTTQLNM